MKELRLRTWALLGLFVFLGVALAVVSERVDGLKAQLPPQGTTRPVAQAPQRIIGVWQQPASSFDKWKSLGVNTLVSFDQSADRAKWMQAAQAAGLDYIVEISPFDTAASVANDPHRKGILQTPDEPDSAGTPPATLQAFYDSHRWGCPIVVNFSGGYVLGIQKLNGQAIPTATYTAYCNAADWIASDIYEVAGWNIPSEGGTNGGVSLLAARQSVDRLGGIAPSKSQLAFIGVNKQNLNWLPNGGRSQTPNETWAVAGSMIPGNVGVVWFTCAFNPFTYDACDAEQHARIAAINKVLSK